MHHISVLSWRGVCACEVFERSFARVISAHTLESSAIFFQVSFYDGEDDNSESITRQKLKAAAGLPPRHEDLRATPFSELWHSFARLFQREKAESSSCCQMKVRTNDVRTHRSHGTVVRMRRM